jgi:hypothetical protein
MLSSCAMTPTVPPEVRADLAPTGKLRVGINYGNFAVATKDPATGELRGVAVDLIQEVGRRAGVPVEMMSPSSIVIMELRLESIFFIGIAGTGMSAIAQYLKGINKDVSGSDRYFGTGVFNETKSKLEAEGIICFEQNGEGINTSIELVVVSTAIEDTVVEIQKAKQLNPDNPRMLYLLGWQKFATPKMWGGDKTLAKQLLTQAKEKLAAESSNTVEPHWGIKEVDEILKQIK